MSKETKELYIKAELRELIQSKTRYKLTSGAIRQKWENERFKIYLDSTPDEGGGWDDEVTVILKKRRGGDLLFYFSWGVVGWNEFTVIRKLWRWLSNNLTEL